MNRRPLTPDAIARQREGGRRGNRSRSEERAEGLAYARAWRIRMKPAFDALYGPEEAR